MLGGNPTMMKSHPGLIIILLLIPLLGWAQSPPSEPDKLPSWVLFGLGQQAYEDKRFGEATVYFRQEAQLQKALDERGLLVVPDDRYALLYALADLRLRADRGTSVEKGEAALETWREILQDDKAYRNVEESGGLEGYYNALMAKSTIVNLKTATGPGLMENLVGLNRLLYLYRHPLGFSLRAHQEIAALSVTNKAYRKAVSHSLFALTGIFSTVIDQVRVLHPDYVFRSLDELFSDADSSVYLGKPVGIRESSAQAGGPNPGWLVRYQPIWDYLRASGASRSLDTLLAALDGLAVQEKTLGTPAGQRPIKEISAEVRRWRSLLFS
jgi:hypothetical protein